MRIVASGAAVSVFPADCQLPGEIALIQPPPKTRTAPFGPSTASKVRAFFSPHQPDGPTPLTPLPQLAAELGVGAVLVKDESKRLGTSAFKVSGAAYAMAEVTLKTPRTLCKAST